MSSFVQAAGLEMGYFEGSRYLSWHGFARRTSFTASSHHFHHFLMEKNFNLHFQKKKWQGLIEGLPLFLSSLKMIDFKAQERRE